MWMETSYCDSNHSNMQLTWEIFENSLDNAWTLVEIVYFIEVYPFQHEFSVFSYAPAITTRPKGYIGMQKKSMANNVCNLSAMRYDTFKQNIDKIKGIETRKTQIGLHCRFFVRWILGKVLKIVVFIGFAVILWFIQCVGSLKCIEEDWQSFL